MRRGRQGAEIPSALLSSPTTAAQPAEKSRRAAGTGTGRPELPTSPRVLESPAARAGQRLSISPRRSPVPEHQRGRGLRTPLSSRASHLLKPPEPVWP